MQRAGLHSLRTLEGSPVLFETLSTPLTKALLSNSVAPAFASIGVSDSPPSGSGVFDIGEGGSIACNRLHVLPYCFGAAGSTFSVRMWAWRGLGGDPSTLVWVPELLAELSCIACSRAGLSGRLVLDTERFVDTIALVAGSLGTGDIVTPGSNNIAHFQIDLRGCKKVQFDFQWGSSPPNSMNALWARA